MNHALLLNVHQMNISRPVGCYRIASFLRQQGWDVEVIEYAAYIPEEQLKEIIRMRVQRHTVFVGFSCYFSHWSDTIENVALWIKQTYSHVSTVSGGQSKPRFNSNAIDYYVHGYGERAIIELTKYLTGNGGALVFDPLFFGSKKVISANQFYPSFPMPSLLVEYEERDELKSWEWLGLEFSRGCKFSCAYCNYPILGVKEDHTRTAEDFQREVATNYQRWGITNYYVADETFNDASEKIVKYANIAQELPFSLYLSGYIRADLLVARKQDWQPLSELGFFGQFYGIETMNAASAKAIGKGMAPTRLQEGILEARDWFRQRGNYRGSIALIIGLPHETVETQQRSFQWLRDHWQGESAHVWALEIPIDPKIDVFSKISKDYNGYGYRKSTIAPRPAPKEFAKFEGDFNPLQIKQATSNLWWENDHLNYSDALAMAHEFSLTVLNNDISLGVCNWGLNQYTAYNARSIDQVLQEVQFFEPGLPNTLQVKSYINKKLKSVKLPG